MMNYKKTFFLFGLLAGTLGFVKAQNVNIPDANFKNALLNHFPRIDTNNDGEIQVSEAGAFAGFIEVSDRNIADFTGIQAFVNITALQCSNNQLTSLDVSKNTALTYLGCSHNQLTSLDVSKNTGLTLLECFSNQLTGLDVSKNTALKTLYCYNNQLTSLDVSKNMALISLYCNNNQLTSLDVTQNTALTTLYCNNNQLTSLNLGENTALTKLWCFYNQLTSLDVSKNIALTDFSCGINQLTTLDVSKNLALEDFRCQENQITGLLDLSKHTALTVLSCRNNLLTGLNLKNGNNSAMTTIMRTENNPNLNCIEVDNPTAIPSVWIKDDTAIYSENCLLSVNDITKKEITLYPNPVKDMLYFSEEVSNIKITDVSGRTIKEFSVTGKSVNMANFVKGVYMISAITKTGKIVTKKIVKE